MILRDLAAAWVRANCPWSDVQSNFLKSLDAAIESRVNCSFIIGHGVVGSGKPYWVWCFCGEFFAFELTPQQAARLRVPDQGFVCATGKRQYDQEQRPAPTVWIEHVEVNQAAVLDRSLPITGTLRYRTDQFLLDPLAIRVVFEPPGRRGHINFHHLHFLRPPEGTLQFSVTPFGNLLDDNGTPFTGILPLFFQIWTAGVPPRPGFGPSPFPQVVGMPAPQPNQPFHPLGWQPVAALPPFMPGPVQPAASPYPPPYDPFGQANPPAQQERPISDIRAVLVEIV